MGYQPNEKETIVTLNHQELTVTIPEPGTSANIINDPVIATITDQPLESNLEQAKIKVVNDFRSHMVDIAAEYYKQPKDTVNVSEQLVLAFNKVLSDTAVMLDIPQLHLFKPLIDIQSSTEQLYFAVSKRLQDTFQTDDKLTIAVNKALLDVYNVEDIVSFLLEKALLDTASVSDELRIETGKRLADTVSISERFAKETNTVLKDTAYMTDVIDIKVTFGRYYLDELFTEEVITLFTDKVLLDEVHPEEIISLALDNTLGIDEAIVSDIISLNAGKMFSDTTTLTENYTLDFGKGIVDTVTPIEALEIIVQDYFLEDYVEIGYVGTKYNF